VEYLRAEQSHLILIRFPVGSFSYISCHTIFYSSPSLSYVCNIPSQLMLIWLLLHCIMLLLLCVHAECWWIANGGQQRHQNDGWDKRSAMPWSRNISKALAVFFSSSPLSFCVWTYVTRSYVKWNALQLQSL